MANLALTYFKVSNHKTLLYVLFAWTYQPYRFSEITVFFSHNKSALASAVFLASRTGPSQLVYHFQETRITVHFRAIQGNVAPLHLMQVLQPQSRHPGQRKQHFFLRIGTHLIGGIYIFTTITDDILYCVTDTWVTDMVFLIPLTSPWW